MIEPSQILLIAVVTILTFLMILIGWQIFIILGEIKIMLRKFNVMTDEAVTLTHGVKKSFQNLNGFSEGVKTAFGIINHFSKKEEK